MTFFSRRNVILALLAGPIVTFSSIGLGVTDQGFDSIAGLGGVLVASAVSAVLSLAAFSVAAVAGNLTMRLLATQTGTAISRVLVSAILMLIYFFIFRLPTPKPQLYVVAIFAFALALTLTPKPRSRWNRAMSPRPELEEARGTKGDIDSPSDQSSSEKP